MVCCCQSTVGSSNSAIGVSQTLKCLGGGHLVDEMSVDVEENSRIIFFVYYMVLEDFVVESAGNGNSRWHNFGILVVCVAEKDGSSLIFVQSSIYALLASITAQCKKKKIVCRVGCRCNLRSSDLAPPRRTASSMGSRWFLTPICMWPSHYIGPHEVMHVAQTEAERGRAQGIYDLRRERREEI